MEQTTPQLDATTQAIKEMSFELGLFSERLNTVQSENYKLKEKVESLEHYKEEKDYYQQKYYEKIRELDEVKATIEKLKKPKKAAKVVKKKATK